MSDFREGFDAQQGQPRRRRRPPSFFWPLMLVGAGVLLLLSNLGYLPWESWNALWRLWPLLLIALGIDVLIGRRSMLGAVVSGLLILLLIGGGVALVLFARDIPALSELTNVPGMRVRRIEYPAEEVEQARLDVDWTSMPSYLGGLRDSPNLIEGEVAYRGELVFDVDVEDGRADVRLDSYTSQPWFGPTGWGQEAWRWEVILSPRVPFDLILDAGSGVCEFDLRDLTVSGLILDVGSGSVDLTLPSEGAFDGRIEGGSGSLDIFLPEGVGMQVVLESGSGSFHPGEHLHLIQGDAHGDGIWETENFDQAERAILLRIDQGSGSIRVTEP